MRQVGGWVEIYALVTVVTPDSPAERAGIQVGDMITRFDGQLDCRQWPCHDDHGV